MSDAPQGDGWWQASNGRWYPPDSVPGTPPPSSPPPAFGAPTPGPGPQPGYGAPPQGGAPGYGPPPAVPTKSSRTAWIVIASILGLLVLVCGGCGLFAYIGVRDAGVDIAEIAQEAGRDFSAGVLATGPSSCQVVGFLGSETDTYTVEVTITNESGIDSHYRIAYDLLGPDNSLLGSDFGIISNVPSGDEVRDTNFGFLSGTTDPADITCQVTEALRIPS